MSEAFTHSAAPNFESLNFNPFYNHDQQDDENINIFNNLQASSYFTPEEFKNIKFNTNIQNNFSFG